MVIPTAAILCHTLKGPPMASNNRTDRSSICLSIFRPAFKVQYFDFGWWYSNHTWTVSSSMGCSHFTDITLPWRWGGSECRTYRVLSYFDFFCRRRRPCFTNACLVFFLNIFSISVYLYLCVNVMLLLDFICTGIASCEERKSSEKFKMKIYVSSEPAALSIESLRL